MEVFLKIFSEGLIKKYKGKGAFDDLKKMLIDIPERQWIVGEHTNRINACCVEGHINRLLNDRPHDYSNENCYTYIKDTRPWIVNPVHDIWGLLNAPITCSDIVYKGTIRGINNSARDLYQQSTPKQRILAYIDDAIKAGW